MFEDDFLMRQLSRFVLGLAESVVGQDVEELDDLEEDVEGLLGAPVELFEAMHPTALVHFFPAGDRLAMRRATALAIAFARRGLERDDDALRGRALLLLDHAAGACPELGQEELEGLRASLRGVVDEGRGLH